MKNYRLKLLLIGLFCTLKVFTQTIHSVSTKVGRLNISVDPRIELLCAIQSISDYQYVNRNTSYSNELVSFFEKDTSLNAVKQTVFLLNEYGFALDAPFDLMLRLTNPPELNSFMPFKERTIERAGGEENLEKYRFALKQFWDETDFEKFWKSKILFYQAIVDSTASDLGHIDPVNVFDAYFNESKSSYNVILSPNIYGGYGMRLPKGDNYDIYACLGYDKITKDIPFYSGNGLSNYLWHEFSHSFVNPLTDKYPGIVESTATLFEPIADDMVLVHCGNWITCINEHVVRALHIRLLNSIGKIEEAQNLVEIQNSRRFIYINIVLNKLKQFELERDNNDVTFTQFYPKLIAVFDSLSNTNNIDLTNPIFEGKVSTVISRNNVAIIYPTNSTDSISLKSVYDYTSMIKEVKGDRAILIADTTAIKSNLSDYWIMAYGTVKSNLYLSFYSYTFPFKVEENKIETNREFTGEKLRIISCLPNPQNNRRGMMINTSVSNKNLKGVRLNFDADYFVFESSDSLLQKGNYRKDDVSNWKF